MCLQNLGWNVCKTLFLYHYDTFFSFWRGSAAFSRRIWELFLLWAKVSPYNSLRPRFSKNNHFPQKQAAVKVYHCYAILAPFGEFRLQKTKVSFWCTLEKLAKIWKIGVTEG
jgi:hypothetical protein